MSEKPVSFEKAVKAQGTMFDNSERFFQAGIGVPLTEETLFRLTLKGREEVHGIIPGPLSAAHYSAIGKVAANWAALEMLINSAIWQIGEIPDEIGGCITSQFFTFDTKIKALIAVLGVRGNFNKTIAALNKFHDRSRGAAQKRNRTVHDPWVGDFKTGIPQRLEITADKKLVSGYKPITTDDLLKLVDEIADLFDEFKEIISPAIERFPPLRDK
ncbi:MAG: hypothetical protein E7774_14985 [Bradyrhizobium sp.]|nr:MAG: hypothetical protein E7774_14985 [Bradyrhizobium sp.]